ncbi:MAG: glycosyltransferase [Gammaproteobacteria bacterium]|nr:glycosyltransferase [Gammaproteobacteria bacterium]
MTNKVVMHVITGLNVGGAEKMLVRLLQNTAHQSVVVSLRDKGVLGEEIAASGIPVHCLYLSRSASVLWGGVKLKVLIERYRPAVVQSWLYAADFLGSYVAVRQNIPSIWNVRQSETAWISGQKHIGLNQRINARMSGKWPSSIVYCGHEARRRHEQIGYRCESSHVIPNGIDIQRFSPNANERNRLRQEWFREWQLDDQTMLIGIVGRYDPLKNHHRFLRTIAALKTRTGKPFRGVMVGRGMDGGNHELRAMIDGLGLSGHCHLLGERGDVESVMNALDRALLTSDSEGWPNVLGEAMACGKICLSTRVGDVDDVLGDAGFTVDVNDEKGLVDACEQAMNLPLDVGNELEIQARKRIVDRFSLSATVGLYDQLYSSYITSQVA